MRHVALMLLNIKFYFSHISNNDSNVYDFHHSVLFKLVAIRNLSLNLFSAAENSRTIASIAIYKMYLVCVANVKKKKNVNCNESSVRESRKEWDDISIRRKPDNTNSNMNMTSIYGILWKEIKNDLINSAVCPADRDIIVSMACNQMKALLK